MGKERWRWFYPDLSISCSEIRGHVFYVVFDSERLCAWRTSSNGRARAKCAERRRRRRQEGAVKSQIQERGREREGGREREERRSSLCSNRGSSQMGGPWSGTSPYSLQQVFLRCAYSDNMILFSPDLITHTATPLSKSLSMHKPRYKAFTFEFPTILSYSP